MGRMLTGALFGGIGVAAVVSVVGVTAAAFYEPSVSEASTDPIVCSQPQ
jgi:hypothetical protein